MARLFTIPEVLDEFDAYYQKNPAWGSLHVVLDEQNLHDDSVRYCIQWANEQGDQEGVFLGNILLLMSKTQRSAIPKLCYARERFRRARR